MLLNLLPGEQGIGPISDDPRGGSADIDWLLRYGGLVPDYEPQTVPGQWANALATEAGGVAVPMGALGRIGRVGEHGSEVENLASKSARLHDFPTKSEVGHAGVAGNPRGFDPEGRPLLARYVVGRTEAGGSEFALPSEALDEIAKRLTGKGIENATRKELGPGVFGRYVYEPWSGTPREIAVWDKLEPRSYDRVSRHEVGHAIDHSGGWASKDGLVSELEQIYSYGVLDGGWGRGFQTRNLKRPKDNGYRGDAIEKELWAEAIRQYSVAPDTMKARFPRVAKRIRDLVNANPKLMDLIQFNSLAGVGLGGLALTSQQDEADDIRAYPGGL